LLRSRIEPNSLISFTVRWEGFEHFNHRYPPTYVLPLNYHLFWSKPNTCNYSVQG